MKLFSTEPQTGVSKEDAAALQKLRDTYSNLFFDKKGHQPFLVETEPGSEVGRQLGQLAPAIELATLIGSIVSLESRGCIKVDTKDSKNMMNLTELTRKLITSLFESFGEEVLPKSE